MYKLTLFKILIFKGGGGPIWSSVKKLPPFWLFTLISAIWEKKISHFFSKKNKNNKTEKDKNANF